jgi:hypothetical protein
MFVEIKREDGIKLDIILFMEQILKPLWNNIKKVIYA